MPRTALDFSREQLAATCKRWHIAKLSVFGSVLREDFRPDSDVDVLVEFEPGHTPGWEIVDIGEELSGVFGGHYVDIVYPEYLLPRLKDEILSSAIVQYERV
ncbi:MAG: nucleotidyltransferase domain-containing protein [Candidatus Hydrogenedentes bacterium]|nr:nucleotidyltransferase domain-containing protein [Candidatus Hydrogenedentota bacterium]